MSHNKRRGSAPLADGSPVSMLSLTRHSPASRTASQGSSRPSWGRTRQSPGTRSKEVTHSSSGRTKKGNAQKQMFAWKIMAWKQSYGLETKFRRRPYVASRDPRIKSKIPHSRLFSWGVKRSLKLMKPFQSCLREMWKLHWCELSLWKPYNLFTWLQVSFHIPLSTCSCDSHGAEARLHRGFFFMQEELSHSWKPSILLLIFSIASI